MRAKEILEATIQNSRDNIKANKSVISEKGDDINRLEKEIKDYIGSNVVASQRDIFQKKKAGFLKLGAAAAILAVVTALVNLILKLIMGAGMHLAVYIIIYCVAGLILAGAVALVIYALTFNKTIASMTQQLATFDVYKNELESQIEGNEKVIANCKKAIKQEQAVIEECEDELEYYKYERYFQGHVLVFVGEKNPVGGKYKNIVNTIEIDNMPQGFAERPFKPILLSPGDHTVRVTVQHEANGVQQNYSSEWEQICADEASVYMLFEFKGPQGGVTVKKFNDIIAFFDATNQEP